MRMRRLGTACVVLLAAGAMAMFGVSSGSATGSPVTIGASLSLSGDFSTDGQAFERGYQLWMADQNKKGGLLGHPIKLDRSSPTPASRRRSSRTTTS